jgi:hypothetical protein
MTCIVGIIDNESKKIYMGGDSAGVGDLSINIRKDSKVFIRNNFIFGFTTSFRMGQLLMCDSRFKLRKQNKKEDDYKYMVDVFIPAVQKLFKKGGFGTIDEGKEYEGGTFLVGYKNKLYTIYDNFQVSELYLNYCSVGCGSDIALGSMYTSDKMNKASNNNNSNNTNGNNNTNTNDINTIDKPHIKCTITTTTEERIYMALLAAETFNCGVRQPFNIISLRF